MAEESFGLGSGGKFEGDVIVITCNVVASPPLKGCVVIVQDSAESGASLNPGIAGEAGRTSEKHLYPRRTWTEFKVGVVYRRQGRREWLSAGFG